MGGARGTQWAPRNRREKTSGSGCRRTCAGTDPTIRYRTSTCRASARLAVGIRHRRRGEGLRACISGRKTGSEFSPWFPEFREGSGLGSEGAAADSVFQTGSKPDKDTGLPHGRDATIKSHRGPQETGAQGEEGPSRKSNVPYPSSEGDGRGEGRRSSWWPWHLPAHENTTHMSPAPQGVFEEWDFKGVGSRGN